MNSAKRRRISLALRSNPNSAKNTAQLTSTTSETAKEKTTHTHTRRTSVVSTPAPSSPSAFTVREACAPFPPLRPLSVRSDKEQPVIPANSFFPAPSQKCIQNWLHMGQVCNAFYSADRLDSSQTTHEEIPESETQSPKSQNTYIPKTAVPETDPLSSESDVFFMPDSKDAIIENDIAPVERVQDSLDLILESPIPSPSRQLEHVEQPHPFFAATSAPVPFKLPPFAMNPFQQTKSSPKATPKLARLGLSSANRRTSESLLSQNRRDFEFELPKRSMQIQLGRFDEVPAIETESKRFPDNSKDSNLTVMSNTSRIQQKNPSLPIDSVGTSKPWVKPSCTLAGQLGNNSTPKPASISDTPLAAAKPWETRSNERPEPHNPISTNSPARTCESPLSNAKKPWESPNGQSNASKPWEEPPAQSNAVKPWANRAGQSNPAKPWESPHIQSNAAKPWIPPANAEQNTRSVPSNLKPWEKPVGHQLSESANNRAIPFPHASSSKSSASSENIPRKPWDPPVVSSNHQQPPAIPSPSSNTAKPWERTAAQSTASTKPWESSATNTTTSNKPWKTPVLASNQSASNPHANNNFSLIAQSSNASKPTVSAAKKPWEAPSSNTSMQQSPVVGKLLDTSNEIVAPSPVISHRSNKPWLRPPGGAPTESAARKPWWENTSVASKPWAARKPMPIACAVVIKCPLCDAVMPPGSLEGVLCSACLALC